MSRRIGLGFASGSLIRSNIVSPAVKPIWNAGWLIVVILGTAIDATSILSKPTTPISLGTFRPYLFAALITESANTSAAQNIASGLSSLPNS